VASIKVLCRNNSKEEMTWEMKEQMKSTYLHFFQAMGGNNEVIMMGCDPTFEDDYSKGGDDVTPNT